MEIKKYVKNLAGDPTRYSNLGANFVVAPHLVSSANWVRYGQSVRRGIEIILQKIIYDLCNGDAEARVLYAKQSWSKEQRDRWRDIQEVCFGLPPRMVQSWYCEGDPVNWRQDWWVIGKMMELDIATSDVEREWNSFCASE
jgi:hypothetical protein